MKKNTTVSDTQTSTEHDLCKEPWYMQIQDSLQGCTIQEDNN